MPQSPASPADAVVLLPAEAFVVRRVPVDASADAAPQAEIALEGLAPFGLGQLYHGRLVQGSHALVFATHRRLFASGDWTDAAAVLPAFVALLGEPPPAPRVRVWMRPGAVLAAAWDGSGTLPAHVVARAATAGGEAGARAGLLADVRARLGADAPLEEFSGEPSHAPGKGGGLVFTLDGAAGRGLQAAFARGEVEAMDVRDAAVLAARRAVARRNGWLWRAVQGAAWAAGLALLLEVAVLAGGAIVRQQRAAADEAAPAIERIQTAQVLGARIDELSRRRLRPFEMLAMVNDVRPAGVVFSRATTAGQAGLEIEAQTANADAVGAYESALRALPAAEAVEIRDLRLRDGLTTFQLTVRFREAALATLNGAGGPP